MSACLYCLFNWFLIPTFSFFAINVGYLTFSKSVGISAGLVILGMIIE